MLDAKDYIPDYMRISLANRKSKSAKEWVEWMQYINTGTYNTQWMVVDLNKARKAERKLSTNTFLLAEQIPGKIIFKDLSNELSNVKC